jgi:intein/homing endonuclease
MFTRNYQLGRKAIKAIRLPRTLTEELAEIVGVVVGDGHVGLGAGKFRVHISGHSEEDRHYIKTRLIPLFAKVFGLTPYQRMKGNEYDLAYNSKTLALFFSQEFGIPDNKARISVPEGVLDSSSKIQKAFLRGLIDTDFSMTFKKKHKLVHYYPVIHGSSCSKNLILQVSGMLAALGIRNYISKHSEVDRRTGTKSTIHHVFISGKEQLQRVIRIIQPQNLKHLSKIRIWEKYGYYPPRLSMKERKAILEDHAIPDLNL